MPPAIELYFDFDHTITEVDVLDEIIASRSVDERWREAEAAWEAGEIGSRECLQRQLAGVRMSASALDAYLRTVRIDPGFAEILALSHRHAVAPVILSDSFTPIIEGTLRHAGIEPPKTFANQLTIVGDEWHIAFPHTNALCSCCGNCKTAHLVRPGRPLGTTKIYVGDGRSDFCPAGFCEVIFAKGSLYERYAGTHPRCHRFESLHSVRDALSDLLS